MQQPDLRVEVRFKNARLWNALVRQYQETAVKAYYGHGQLPILRVAAKSIGVPYGVLGDLLGLRRPPYRKNGNLTSWVQEIADALDDTVENLFPPDLYCGLFQGVRIIEQSSRDVISLGEAARQNYRYLPEPEEAVLKLRALTELRARLEEVRKKNYMDAAIVELYFGLEGEPRTLVEIGETFQLSTARVGQRLSHGLRRLRHGLGCEGSKYPNLRDYGRSL